MRVLHWMQLALGLWVAISPWLLGASARTPISWSNVVAGAAMALIGLWGLLSERGENEAGSADESPLAEYAGKNTSSE